MSPWLSDRLLSSQSDERLAALASAGSERAFAVIVQRYRRPLLAFARHLAPSGDIEDLVQQTFMSALAAMRTGVEVRHLRGWLHQILRHAAIQASKRALVPAELEHANLVTPSAQQAAEARMLTAEALAALAKLPARQHEAMVATAIHGRSRAEVAQLLGLSEGAVRQLVHRARESLRAAVTAITPYPLAQALAGGSGGGVADLVAGAGAGSAGALAVKIGAVLASGVVATGIVTSNVHGRSHRGHHAQGHVVVTARATDPTGHGASGTRLAAVGGAGTQAGRQAGRDSGRGRGGPGPSGGGSDGGPGPSSDGSSGGPSLSSGSSDGDGSTSGSSGGPSATTATSSDGGSGSTSGGSGSSDGGTTPTTTTSGSDGGGGSGSSDGGTTTTGTSGSSDGGSSGGSGSGDMTATTSSTDGH
jgi:RNA polymerase sigma factor (sigma-70 family)